MAQFGVTGQGYQDPIKGHLREQKSPEEQPQKSLDTRKSVNLPYEGISDVFNESIYTNRGNEGSYSKLKTMTTKHIRESRDPNQIYDVCITDNQNYGWNVKMDSSNDLSWAETAKYPHKNSQMTKFVDDMALTNREFSLY